MRLDALARTPTPAPDEMAAIQQALDRAMAEIRQISKGLVLPELAHLPAEAIVRLAVEAHQARVPAPVAVELETDGAPPLTPGLRICLYRFVQEGLNNAARHAGGADVAVRLQGGAGMLRLTVADAGAGPPRTTRRGWAAGIARQGRIAWRPLWTGAALRAHGIVDGGRDMSGHRVVVADDHPLFREGVARTLQESGRFAVVATAASGAGRSRRRAAMRRTWCCWTCRCRRAGFGRWNASPCCSPRR